MKAPKESQSERALRISAEEGGRRFRSKVWSKTGKDKCPKALRRKGKKHLV